MRLATILLVTLASTCALSSVSCGSSDGNKSQTPASNNGSCNPLGIDCTTQGYTELALCKNQDESQFWYLVCSDAQCTTGKRIDCAGADCDSAMDSAMQACLPQLGG
jgi:hypothetical protein